MKQKLLPYIVGSLIIIWLGTLAASRDTPRVTSDNQQSEKINLALRQTAHRLLKQEGDSISMIAPIQQTAPNVYIVRLEHDFNYDSLASFLHHSFTTYHIEDDYNVAVWDCTHTNLILGYSSIDFFKRNDIPCSGRDKNVQCINFTVSFPEAAPSNFALIPFILGGLSVLILLGMVYWFFKYKNKTETDIASQNNEPIDNTHLIIIGQSIFNTRQNTVVFNNITQKLTFREAKLLQLFCNHKQELLERDFILKHIWEDEGVLVGRSVDVFVSRLRKILKNDESLKIMNVHSRGYRFDIDEHSRI